MHFIEVSDAPFWEALIRIIFILLKYFVFAGTAYLLLYIWRRREFWRHKIQQRLPKKGSIQSEIYWSVISRLLMGGVAIITLYFADFTRLYFEVDEYGITYFVLSIPVLLILHDAYFYFTHRLMHHPKIYRYVHKVHHQSINPTPWASFSFHPSEAFIEVLFLPIFLLLFPIHPIALVIMLTFQTVFNIYGHAGFELLASWWVRHPVLKYINTSVHHNLHHKEFHYNYGLYFNHWDRIFNTLDPDYEQKFYAVKDRAVKMKEQKGEGEFKGSIV